MKMTTYGLGGYCPGPCTKHDHPDNNILDVEDLPDPEPDASQPDRADRIIAIFTNEPGISKATKEALTAELSVPPAVAQAAVETSTPDA